MAAETATVGIEASPGGGSRDERRNYVLGVINGSFGVLGWSFVEPSLVLTAFVFEVTGSKVMVGVLATMAFAGMSWPQLWFSRRIEHMPRKRPFYVQMTAVRAVSLALMAASMWLTAATGSRWPIYAFLGAFFLYGLGDGGGGLVFYDLVGSTVRAGRLGGYFALRSLLGDSLALAGSLVVIQPVVANVKSPWSYAILATVGLGLLSVAWVAMCLTREEDGGAPPAERRFWQTVREAAGVMVHDRTYRALIICRLLMRFTMLALVFFVPYGVERLGIVKAGGLFVMFWTGSRLAGAPVWGLVADRAGPRACMIASGALFAVSPALAMLAPHLPPLFAVPLPLTDLTLDATVLAYLLALCVFGMAFRGNVIGINTLLIESAPPARRASYIAFLNTLLLPLAALPALAGWLVNAELIHFDAVFVVAAVAGAASAIVATRLKQTRTERGRTMEL